jgi:hypothetical protein
LKSFFGVKKEVNEIKISVTQEKFLKESWKVGKKKLHTGSTRYRHLLVFWIMQR